jgi:hypothetical protein
MWKKAMASCKILPQSFMVKLRKTAKIWVRILDILAISWIQVQNITALAIFLSGRYKEGVENRKMVFIVLDDRNVFIYNAHNHAFLSFSALFLWQAWRNSFLMLRLGFYLFPAVWWWWRWFSLYHSVSLLCFTFTKFWLSQIWGM